MTSSLSSCSKWKPTVCLQTLKHAPFTSRKMLWVKRWSKLISTLSKSMMLDSNHMHWRLMILNHSLSNLSEETTLMVLLTWLLTWRQTTPTSSHGISVDLDQPLISISIILLILTKSWPSLGSTFYMPIVDLKVNPLKILTRSKRFNCSKRHLANLRVLLTWTSSSVTWFQR